FRMDPATHNPIQDIYICQVIAKGDGISTKVLATSKNVMDPGKKIYLSSESQSHQAPPEACMELLVAQLLNGLVYGVLLFLMAAGLSLIFGLLECVSLAPASFFMLGAFFGLSIFKFTGSFWLALILAPIPVVAIGIVMEFVFTRPLYRRGHMDQVLLTFGFPFVFFDLVQTLWGRLVLRLPAPELLQGTVNI